MPKRAHLIRARLERRCNLIQYFVEVHVGEQRGNHSPLRREAIEQGAGQPFVAEHRRQASPLLTPKPRGREVLPPPHLPAHQRAPVDAELGTQCRDPAGRGTVGDRGQQDYPDAEVHAAIQKAQGRRGGARPAAVTVTTKTLPALLVRGEIRRTSARLAGIVRPIEPSAAGTTLGPGLFSEILVESVEKVEKNGCRAAERATLGISFGVGI